MAIASEVLAQQPTAIIAYNDLMAIGVIKGMCRAGVRVPHDINVVGFDNIALSAIVDHGLTTVAAGLRAMGIIGVENLIATIGGATPSRDPLVLPAKLLVRGSTGPRRRNGISPVLPTTSVSRVFLEDGAVHGDPVEVAELGWAAHLHLCPSPGSPSSCF